MRHSSTIRNHFTYTRAYALLVVVAAVGGVGCMTSPYHNEHMGSLYNSFKASGYVLNAGESIDVEFYNWSTGNWEHLATAQSSNTTYYWSDEQWHPWQTGNLVVPSTGWGYANEFESIARIRAVSGSSTLFTFEDEFFECWDIDKTVGEVWQDCGHSNEVTIRAYH